MSATDISLIIIASLFLIKGIIFIIVVVKAFRIYRRDITPLVHKADGVLKNLSSISETAREEMEEVRSVIEDITYQSRQVTTEFRERIVPTMTEIAGVASGIGRIFSYFFSKKKNK